MQRPRNGPKGEERHGAKHSVVTETVFCGKGWLSLLRGEGQGGDHIPPVPLPGTGLWAGQLVLHALLRPFLSAT